MQLVEFKMVSDIPEGGAIIKTIILEDAKKRSEIVKNLEEEKNMTNNSKKRLEEDRATVRKFQIENKRRADELRRKIAVDDAKVKKFFQEGR